MPFDIKDISTVVAILTGTAGFTLSIMNYFRDKAKININLQWDLSSYENMNNQDGKKFGLIKITNVGRRPIFISHVAIKFPRGSKPTHLLQFNSITGVRIAEGDPPLSYPINQDQMAEYSSNWHKIIVEASDSTGKIWISKRVCKKNKPSWVK
jgi:hypothetical protein